MIKLSLGDVVTGSVEREEIHRLRLKGTQTFEQDTDQESDMLPQKNTRLLCNLNNRS